MSRFDTFLHQLTLANQLTFLRLAAVPMLAFTLLGGHAGWALGIYLLAAVTDRLDGIAARRLGQQTALGAILDPAADKLMMLVTYITLAIPNQPRVFPEFSLQFHVPAWLALLVAARDVVIVTVALSMYLAYGESRFPPLRLGKWTTGFEMATGGLVLLANVWPGVPGPLLAFAMVSTGLLLVASGVAYLLRTSRSQRGRGPGPAA
jgi:cardiolipin synthase (CMP-forming)